MNIKKLKALAFLLTLAGIASPFYFGVSVSTVLFLIGGLLVVPFALNGKRAFSKKDFKFLNWLLPLLALVLIITGLLLFNTQKAPADEPIGEETQTVETNSENVGKKEPQGERSSDDVDVTYGLEKFKLSDVPGYKGESYCVINNNEPFFENVKYDKSFEIYCPLDNLKRCTNTFANIGKDIMPTEKRGDISSVKPSGWKSVQYDFVDGKSLYNRCHLIGFQLAGENANKQNLVTGTRYMNTVGMLPFENMVADYVKETGNHVLYRVTPIFEGNELVCRGVLMEARSVEDNGEEICFNVFCYNVQPGVSIDYATGNSSSDK